MGAQICCCTGALTNRRFYIGPQDINALFNPCQYECPECMGVVATSGSCSPSPPYGVCCEYDPVLGSDCGDHLGPLNMTEDACIASAAFHGYAYSFHKFVSDCIDDPSNPTRSTCHDTGACCSWLGCQNLCPARCARIQRRPGFPAPEWFSTPCYNGELCGRGACCGYTRSGGPRECFDDYSQPGCAFHHGGALSWHRNQTCEQAACVGGACCVCGDGSSSQCFFASNQGECNSVFGKFFDNSTCNQVRNSSGCLGSERQCLSRDGFASVSLQLDGPAVVRCHIKAELVYDIDSRIPCRDWEGSISIGARGNGVFTHAEIGNRWKPDFSYCETAKARTIIRDDMLTPSARFQFRYVPACAGDLP